MSDKRDLLRSLTIDRVADMPAAGRPAPASGGSWRWLLLGGLVLVVGVGAGLAGARYLDGDAAPAPVATVAPPSSMANTNNAAPATAAIAAPRPTNTLVASGYIVARRMATVSAEITGRVQDVLVDEGMVVKQGQVLARLDDTLAAIDLDLAKARVAAADAQLEQFAADLRDAERILARTNSLSGNNVASEAELTRTRARAEALRAGVKGAQADARVARFSVDRQAATLDKHIVRAPFDGVVIDKSAQPGEIISPMSSGGFTRTGVCTLVDMDSLEVEVDVNEANIGRVRAGQKVEAVLDAYPDWKIPASVIAVVPTANRDKATIKVRIALGAKDGRILPDMGAKVTFLDARPAG